MGQRSSTETVFGIIAAFIEKSTWTQADLARRFETRTETIRRHLEELQAGGLPLEREEEKPQVYWSVPKNWIPGALAFKDAEARDLLRLIARAPQSDVRDSVMDVIVKRLGLKDFDASAVRAPKLPEGEEKWLSLLEDAATKKVPVKMRYFTSSRGDERWRHVSVHRVDIGARAQFIGTCHRAEDLRRFRVSNVLDARFDSSETHRKTTAAALQKFDRESFGGYRDDGPIIRCSFLVRLPEAAWVAKNLPDERIEQETTPKGIRFSTDTAGVTVLARFVAGLGEVAIPETKELAEEVAVIAQAALANARGSSSP